MQAASMIQALDVFVDALRVLRFSAVSCEEHSDLCTQHGVKTDSELRVRPIVPPHVLLRT